MLSEEMKQVYLATMEDDLEDNCKHCPHKRNPIPMCCVSCRESAREKYMKWLESQ